MKKQFVHVFGCSAGLLAAVLLSMVLLSIDTHVAAAQGIEQQAPMTDTMPMSGTMPARGGMGNMGGMGEMAQMMEMMERMEQRMAQMEERMGAMQGSMPMGDQADGKGQGDMMGQGSMMQRGGDHEHMRMMMQMMMMMHMMDMMHESSGMSCEMMDKGMMGQGGMMGEGGMMGQGGMMGEGGMMGQGGMMGSTQPMTGTMGAGAGNGPGPRAGADSSDERTAELGGIQLKATPVNLADRNGETLDFSVDLEAQGQALDFDVAPLARLMVGSEEVAASSWTVNFDHGHHVNGTLSFPLADVASALTAGAQVMVHIDQADGGGSAMFSWDVAE